MKNHIESPYQDKICVYVDMDDTLYDFRGAFRNKQGERIFPHSREGFFLDLAPLPDAIETVKTLIAHDVFHVMILTAPSIKNTHCYTEKADAIKRDFGEQLLNNMIISPDKGIISRVGVRKQYLIDDYDHGKGQENFQGDLLHFGQGHEYPDRLDIQKYFFDAYGVEFSKNDLQKDG